MPESSISPADRLPEPGTLLTRKVLQDQRHKLLERLVAKEKLWDDEYNQYAKNSNPDQDQLASISAMSNAYRSFFPYADPSPRPLSYFDHTNQITAQDIVKKRHAVSQLSEADLKELDKYKSLAIFTQFATELADRGRPIKYTQESHDICGIYWGIYGMRPGPDTTNKPGSSKASNEAVTRGEKLEAHTTAMRAMKELAWLESGKPDGYTLPSGWQNLNE